MKIRRGIPSGVVYGTLATAALVMAVVHLIQGEGMKAFHSFLMGAAFGGGWVGSLLIPGGDSPLRRTYRYVVVTAVALISLFIVAAFGTQMGKFEYLAGRLFIVATGISTCALLCWRYIREPLPRILFHLGSLTGLCLLESMRFWNNLGEAILATIVAGIAIPLIALQEVFWPHTLQAQPKLNSAHEEQ